MGTKGLEVLSEQGRTVRATARGPVARGVSDLGLDGEVGPDRPGLEEHGREEV